MILTLIGGLNNIYGFGGTQPYCLWALDTTYDQLYATFYFPVGAALVVGGLFMFPSIIQIWRSTIAGSSSTRLLTWSWIKLGILKKSLLFIGLNLFFWVVGILYLASAQAALGEYEKSYDEWISCEFKHFDKANPLAWKNTCGSVAAFRVDFEFSQLFYFFVSSQSLMLAVVYIGTAWVVFKKWLKETTFQLQNYLLQIYLYIPALTSMQLNPYTNQMSVTIGVSQASDRQKGMSKSIDSAFFTPQKLSGSLFQVSRNQSIENDQMNQNLRVKPAHIIDGIPFPVVHVAHSFEDEGRSSEEGWEDELKYPN
jgi:hypothetical protein